MKVEFEQIERGVVGTVEDGMLLVDKPAGVSSFGVVAVVRGAVRRGMEGGELNEGAGRGRLSGGIGAGRNLMQKSKKIKVGHTGTLDPFATGLLILMLGKGTKRCQEFLKLDKWYEAELVLGARSTTGDPEGEITAGTVAEVRRAETVTVAEVRAAAEGMKGELWQTVPRFSAVKVEGRRAYELARKGVEVEMPRRRVEVYEMEVMEVMEVGGFSGGVGTEGGLGVEGLKGAGAGVFKGDGLSAGSLGRRVVKFRCHVSSGTYVRALGEDLAGRLGTVGYLRGLRRTRIGGYGVENAIKVENGGKI